MVVFDLDPGPGTTILDCGRVALRVREALADLGLQSVPKSSGWAGLHVYVPLNSPHDYAQTKPFARRLARRLAEEHSEEVTDRMDRHGRGGRVFIDWGQNDASKSTVAPYSVRASIHPSVSTPLSWAELEAAVGAADPGALLFDPSTVLARLDRDGDLFLPVLEAVQALPA